MMATILAAVVTLAVSIQLDPYVSALLTILVSTRVALWQLEGKGMNLARKNMRGML